MSKFRFSVSGQDARREGVIESESFVAAIDSLSEHVVVTRGDLLEIGVYGFPPAKLNVSPKSTARQPIWMPAGQLAA